MGALASLRESRVVFVGGKGGVGKTSTAGALGVLAANRGKRCLVVSTDPAHSLGDLFDREIGDRITGLTAGLWGLEIDPDAQARRHVDAVTEHMKQLAAPEMHKELERQMHMARHSPGAAEAALLERIASIILSAEDEYDLLIFDTAPTGHTLRLLSLPEAMAAWTDGLLAHNKRSEELGKVLKHLTPGQGRADVPTPFDDPQEDPFEGMDRRTRRIAETLLERRRLFHRARRVITDAATTSFVFVLTPERLPILETARAVQALREFSIPVRGAIVNRVIPADADGSFLARRREREERYLQEIDSTLTGLDTVRVPMFAEDIQGLPSLDALAALLEEQGL
ncbi:ArsA family ATPase [Aquisalimonas asiatica]|uniref:arsenite-transporting ATPase n=1 Tax=Aquisalimonas asiatica TaxID=406100 RepID=A0A1H8Q4H9_9GAMM|nr:ArsA family ATPase [Aquisalimonas asiatica]SEO49120.1 arsenite-transporting ATPase [Aquisalimonas asiatica]